VRFVIYEPVPQNLEQIREHLTLNGVQAEVVGACSGERRGTFLLLPRGEPGQLRSAKPYASVMVIPVMPLRDAIGPGAAERILIKLDIEGMEVEALSTFILWNTGQSTSSASCMTFHEMLR